MDSCIISFNLNCIMQLKQFYNIATKVNSRKKCYYFSWSTWLLSICLRLSQFSQLSLIQYVGLCVVSLPFSIVIIVRICSFILLSSSGCLTVVIHIRKWRLTACIVMVTPWRLFLMRNKACHPLRLNSYRCIQKYQTHLYISRSTTSWILCCVCLYAHKSRLTVMDN